jgi:putative transposase
MIHAATLWQCDFFSKRVLTIKGFRDLFVLVFLHVESRRVFISPATYHPHEAWVQEQAHAFLRHVEGTGLKAEIVMHDRDTKLTPSCDDILESADLELKKAAHRSPNTVAFVQRFIQTLQHECLNYFIVFGAQHMDSLVSEMLAYDHEERPHQAKDNDPWVSATASASLPKKCQAKRTADQPVGVVPIEEVECRRRLGGLLKHDYRKAA